MLEFKSYSQYGEDEILKTLVKENGYFLEIGSYHPTIFSNTRFLVERGWSGCYVDGSPSAIQRFIEEYKRNTSIKIVQALVGNKNSLFTFYDSLGDGISTTDESHMIKWNVGGSEFREIVIPMITFDTLLEVLPSHIDFINIDVEGQSADLAMSIDYDKCNTKVICIEHDNKIQELINNLRSKGFSYRWHNSTNIIFTKNE
jgi:FkbM family methyltransferase